MEQCLCRAQRSSARKPRRRVYPPTSVICPHCFPSHQSNCFFSLNCGNCMSACKAFIQTAVAQSNSMPLRGCQRACCTQPFLGPSAQKLGETSFFVFYERQTFVSQCFRATPSSAVRMENTLALRRGGEGGRELHIRLYCEPADG